MEIKISSVKYDGIKFDNIILESDKINSLIGKNCDVFVKYLMSNEITFKNKKIKTIYIGNKIPYFYTNSLENELLFFSENYEIPLDTVREKIVSILDVMEIDRRIYDQEILTLSKKERQLISMIINLTGDYDIVVFDKLFSMFDYNIRKKIKKLFNYLRQNNKVVVLVNDNADIIFDIADFTIILDDKIIINDTYKIYADIPLLLKYNINIPTLSLITYKAKKDKNIKLFYSRDVRDIIKDIYKHV